MAQKITVGEGGRIVIPSFFRKELDVHVGDELIINIENGELRLFKQRQAIRRIQDALKRRFPDDVNMTDLFLKERKLDSGE